MQAFNLLHIQRINDSKLLKQQIFLIIQINSYNYHIKLFICYVHKDINKYYIKNLLYNLY